MGRPTKTKIEDITTAGILVTYAVQHLRKPTRKEIEHYIGKTLNFSISKALRERALDAAKNGGFITHSLAQNDEGTAEYVYAMRSAIWGRPPEQAQNDPSFLRKLTESEDAIQVKAYFDSQEGKGSKKASARPVPGVPQPALPSDVVGRHLRLPTEQWGSPCPAASGSSGSDRE